MNLSVAALVAPLALGIVGCEKKTEEAAKPAAAASAAVASAAAAASAAVASATAVASVAASEGAAPASAAGSEAAKALEGMAAALGAAAGAQGGTPCEQAYNGIEAMVKAMEAKMGPGKSKPLPPKDKFVAACGELPETVQKCMSMNYAMANQQECQDAQAKMDPAAKEKFKAAMGGM